MESPKVAFVKSTRYADLWICEKTNDIQTVFKTSFMRCSPIGFDNATFLIVKESPDYPCQAIVYPWEKKFNHNIRNEKTNKLPCLSFLDETYHKDVSLDDVSINPDDVKWDDYDIIITVNACVPRRITEKYPRQLWCYYVSENDGSYIESRNKLGGYDLILNQDVHVAGSHTIGFPYTVVGPTTLERLNRDVLGYSVESKSGIYVEINNTTERPVVTVPSEFVSLSSLMPIVLHSQNIVENSKRLYASKYFVKLYGRAIRGNAILESISSGTLVLANRKKVVYKDLVPDSCHVETVEQVADKIRYFEANPDEYARALAQQRDILNAHYFAGPIARLYEKYRENGLRQTVRQIKPSLDRTQ